MFLQQKFTNINKASQNTMPNATPSKTWIFRFIVAFVIACHGIVLYILPSTWITTESTKSTKIVSTFSTRTIELAPPFAQENSATDTITENVITDTETPRKTTEKIDLQPEKLNTSTTTYNIENQTDTGHIPADSNRAHKMSDAVPVTKQPIEEARTTPQTTRYAVPAPAILKYDIKGEVKGFSYFANGQLSWQHNGTNYDAQLEISHFLLGSRTQTSSGQIGARGLEPQRFTDKSRTETVAQLDHNQKQVTFTADASRTPLEEDAQDQLSIFLQLSTLLAGNPERFKTGDRLAFQAVGAKSSEHWTFEVGQLETLSLPGGIVQALKLTRHPATEGAPKVEVWLAPTMQFLPVRIRLIQSDGDFVEQQWRSTKKPQ